MIGSFVNETSVTAVSIQSCHYCGLIHTAICPRIQRIEYHPDGSVARVEFFDRPFLPFSPPPVGPQA